MTTAAINATVDSLEDIVCHVSGLTATLPSGEVLPLDQCSWILIQPCGCLSGITLAFAGDDHVITSRDAAVRNFSDNATDYKRMVKNGVDAACIPQREYAGRIMPIFRGACLHVPKWGVPDVTRTVGGVQFTMFGEYGADAWFHVKDGVRWEVVKRRCYWLHKDGDRDLNNAAYLGEKVGVALAKAASKLTEVA